MPGRNDAPPFRGNARYAVLATLSFGDELTGYAIHQRIAIMFRYFFGNLAHSQVYKELRHLEEMHWVSSTETGRADRPVRAYRLTDQGYAELRLWAHSAHFDPPTLRFPVALKVWLGHLTEVSDLREALTRQQRYGEDMLDTIEQINRGTSVEPRWRYPDLVNEWSRRIWEATQEATAELLAELDKLEAQPPEKPARRGARKRQP
jgi:DNA-binding PadR family transcriptional regulator